MANDYLPETEHSAAYRSEFLTSLGTPDSEEWRILSALPCSYVDSPTSSAPTLLSLKRHAQSLCALFHAVIPEQANAFDWLSDLTVPYENDDTSHNTPLITLMNNLQTSRDESHMPVDVCPLHRPDMMDPKSTVAHPYATHRALLKHSNECLERLDHEYSASGGIMSIIPYGDERGAEIRDSANSTLIGQMIIYTQGLVVRNRELELGLDDMRALVAGESMIPREILIEAGAAGRLAKKVFSFPQDRFILAGMTDAKWSWLCAELDRQDVHMGNQRVDLVATFTRPIRQTTVFISFQELSRRRDEQAGPAVVKVVMPKWPQRATLWEEKHEQELSKARKLVVKCASLEQTVKRLEEDIKVLDQERRHLKRWQAISKEDPILWTDFSRRMAWTVKEATLNARENMLNEMQEKLAKESKSLEREKEGFEKLQATVPPLPA